MTRAIVDLFAGPGGWDLGARAAGLSDPLGVEWGDEEVATRLAAGLDTLHGDVGLFDPRQVVADRWGAAAKLDGLIASPPCQAWSLAGKGKGRVHDVEECEAALVDLVGGQDTRAIRAERCQDPRSILVVEPLRWALDLAPTWMAWEQVPPVLPFWEECARHLRTLGYDVWTGTVSAEQYGVPQTRKRAILLAANDGRPVGRPAATHRRYLPPRKLPDAPSLFDADEHKEHRVHPEDHDLAPWVSMAQALGVLEGPVPAPSPTIVGSNGGGGDALDRMPTHGRTRAYAALPESYAQGLNGGTRGPRAALLAGATHLNTGRDWKKGGTRKDAQTIPTTEPSPTVSGVPGQGHWTAGRPATTVAGDPRIHPPGHKTNADDVAAGREYDGRAGKNATRVSVVQAAVLQSFPIDHPWQGNASAQFRQVGNAVPPRLAEHVLRAIAHPKDTT